VIPSEDVTWRTLAQEALEFVGSRRP
jgi:hypothetical protein